MLMRSVDLRERVFLVLALLGGAGLRLLWLAQVGGSIFKTYGSAEASRIALSVAQGRGIADAYYPGYGPTAHMMPTSPAIAGLLLRLLGPETASSNMALLCWSLVQVGGAILLLRLLFQRLGADRVAVRWATAVLCLLTPFITQETIDFRYWEGAAALCLGVLNLLLISRMERSPQPDARDVATIAALAALTLFVSPPIGLAAGLCWTVFAFRRLDFRRLLQLGLFTAVAVLMVLTPWVVRNQRAFGEPVLFRSNFGLELAIANHPGALADDAPELIHVHRVAAIHPFQGAAVPPFVVAPAGEVAYSHKLAVQTWAWIAANPLQFARLYFRHLREFFFPERWELYFSGWSDFAGPRAMLMSTVDLMGLAGLAVGLHRRRRGYWMLALFLTALGLQYALFEPATTHMYPAYCILAFLAVEFVNRAARALLIESAGGHVEEANAAA